MSTSTRASARVRAGMRTRAHWSNAHLGQYGLTTVVYRPLHLRNVGLGGWMELGLVGNVVRLDIELTKG